MARAQIQEPEEASESYISIGLGLLVVVVVGILLYNYFTQKSPAPEKTAEEVEKAAQEATMSAQPGTTYTVVEGDTLWLIAEKSYKSGYNWVDIAKANNLTDADALEAGQKLVIPEASPILPAVETALIEPTPVPTPAAVPSEAPAASPVALASPPLPTTITGSTYTVVAGDTLWDIACRAYGDCYAWSRIATENKLVNPDLIHPDNVFTLPR